MKSVTVLLLLSLPVIMFNVGISECEKLGREPHSMPRKRQIEMASKNKTEQLNDARRRYKMMTFDYLADHHRNPFDDFKLGANAMELVWSFVNKLPKSLTAPSSSAVITQRKRNLQREFKRWR